MAARFQPLPPEYICTGKFLVARRKQKENNPGKVCFHRMRVKLRGETGLPAKIEVMENGCYVAEVDSKEDAERLLEEAVEKRFHCFSGSGAVIAKQECWFREILQQKLF